MNRPRYTEEFKIEAVKQVTELGHPVTEVIARLGVSGFSLYLCRPDGGETSMTVQVDRHRCVTY